MKLRESLAKLIETSTIDDKESLIIELAKVQDVDLGETFTPLSEAINRMIDSKVAHENPEIADRVRTRVVAEFNKAQISNFKDAGLSDGEIEELAKLEPTERTAAYTQMLDKRYQVKYNATQSERELQLEALNKAIEAEREKDRVNFETRLRSHEREIAKEQINHSLNTFTSSLPLNPDVFTPTTRVSIASDLIRRKVQEFGGDLFVVDGQLKALSPKGESLWDGNIQMDLTKIAHKALSEQNLIRATPKPDPRPNPGGKPSGGGGGKENRAAKAYLKYV